MRRTLILIILLQLMVSCGGIQQTDKTATGTASKKITADPQEITCTTSYSDPGTWNSVQVVISTIKQTKDNKEKSVDGKVRITNSSEYIKIYNEDGKLLDDNDSVSTIGGMHNLTIAYFTQGKSNALEYASNVVFQFDSTSVVLPVKVQKPQTPTFSIESIPNAISETSSLSDPGTWNTKTAIITLSAGSDLISDTISVYTRDGNYVTVRDKSGNIVNNGTIETDSQGRAVLSVACYTKAALAYTDSIELFYGNVSKSIPITVTAESPEQIKTMIYPASFDFKDPAGDQGTWRAAYFNVYTQDNDGNFIGNADISLSASSQYTKILCNDVQQSTCQTKTDSHGVYTSTIYFYTQTSPLKIEYNSALIANEAISPIIITGDSTANESFTLNVTPIEYTFNYSDNDAGTWRSQYFVIVVNDKDGNLVPNAEITIVSPHEEYTKLYNGNTEIPSPMIVHADANGQYNLRVDYFTRQDHTANPATKLTYSGQLVVSYKQYSKTVRFSVQ